MKIEITKQNAKSLRTAIWLLTQTCNKNKPDNEKFELNKSIAADLRVKLDDIIKLNELSATLRENFKIE